MVPSQSLIKAFRWIVALPVGMAGSAILTLVVGIVVAIAVERLCGPGSVSWSPLDFTGLRPNIVWGAGAILIATVIAPRPLGRAALILAALDLFLAIAEGVVYHLRGQSWNYLSVLGASIGSLVAGLAIALLDRNGWLSKRLRV